MYTRLVVASDIERGIYSEWRGLRNPIRGQMTGSDKAEEGLTPNEQLKLCPVWACMEEDVDEVVEKLSSAHVGSEIKVFNLTQASTRIPGELIHKRIDKDGVLPR